MRKSTGCCAACWIRKITTPFLPWVVYEPCKRWETGNRLDPAGFDVSGCKKGEREARFREENPNSALCSPVYGFGSRVGETAAEVQQKITKYITQFKEEVRKSEESLKTLQESMTHWVQDFKVPSVERTTYDRLECSANHQVFLLIGEKIVGGIITAVLKSVLYHWMELG